MRDRHGSPAVGAPAPRSSPVRAEEAVECERCGVAYALPVWRSVRMIATRSSRRSATSRLERSGSSSGVPSRPIRMTRLVSLPKPLPSPVMSFATIRSRFFSSSSALRVGEQVFALGREADADEVAGRLGQDIGVGDEFDRQACAAAPRFLILWVAGLRDAIVRDGGRHDQHIGLACRGLHRLEHLDHRTDRAQRSTPKG